MSEGPVVSHGRGGQGNIGRSSQEYVDGEIYRQGDPNASGNAYSTGRGGAANIGTPKPGVTPTTTKDEDVIPEAAKVPVHEGEVYHSGRGGEGNAFVAGEEKKKKVAHHGLADKLKNLIAKVLGKKEKA